MSSLRENYGKIVDSRKFPLQRSFTRDGTLLGDPIMNVNGSVTPVEFYYKAEPNRKVTINKLQFVVSDAGNSSVNNYGGLSGPLTNGITFYTIINGQEIPLTPIIKRTADYFSVGASSEFVDLSGSTRLAIYSFSLLNYSEGIILNGDNEDILGLRIRDNLSALQFHRASVDGNFQFISAV